MARRRTVLILMLAGSCLVAIAAVLTAIGSDWRLKVPAAGAAIAMFCAGIVQTRVSATLDRRHQDKAKLEQGNLMLAGNPTGKRPLVRDVANPLSVGVHAAARSGETSGADRRIPPYVPRDIDTELHQALTSSGFILLVGAAAAGKTRTGYEAIRAVLPSHFLVAPAGVDDLPVAMTAAHAERDCVLWLDNLQRYLGGSAVTSKGIYGLITGEGHHRVVVATLRAAEESRLIRISESLSDGQSVRDGRAVLDLVDRRLVVEREFSEAERARAAQLAAQDSRLADALRHVDRYGVAEYLSSGPHLHTEWSNAWERGMHPYGAALVAAAVDLRRAGFAAPLPRTLLDELSQEYLEQRGGTSLRPEPLAEAWTWTTELRDSGSSLLWSAGHDAFDVLDYLVDARMHESNKPVPESTIRTALRFAKPADAVTIAATAWHQDRPELAEAGFRSAYTQLRDTEGPDAAATLASRSDLAVTLHALDKLPDAETEYRAIFTRRTATIGAEHVETLISRNNLAVVLHAQHRLAEAHSHYRAVLDHRIETLGAEHPNTLVTRNNLGVLLMELGQITEAAAELSEVVRLRTKVLGAEHPHTVISRGNLDTLRRKFSGG